MASSKHNISILGTGNMGRALGLRLAAIGYSVFFAGRDPSGPPKAAAEQAGATARSGTLDEAADFGDIFIWTARVRDPLQVFSSAEIAAKLDGKIVVDLNNRDYAGGVVDNDDSRWFDTSLGEMLQDNMPKSHVVKAFNTIAMEVLDTSAESLKKSGAQIFVAGNDDEARDVVNELAADLGLESVDLGPGKVAMKAAEALGDVVRYFIIDRKLGGKANIGLRMLAEPDLDLVGGRAASKYS
jgi:8-hydroxy-5-deazaflavin:NADPH oxidoreductase